MKDLKVTTTHRETTRLIRDNNLYISLSLLKPATNDLKEIYGFGIDYNIKDKLIVGSSFKSDLRGNNYVGVKLGFKIN